MRLNADLEDRWQLARPEPLRVVSTEGINIDAWGLPPAKCMSGHRLPLVLEVHGGRHLHSGNAFFHEFQVLAAQGCIVVYSNP
jgi:dipeptidyl aminopeptidase/acylaminoacyl peptidase